MITACDLLVRGSCRDFTHFDRYFGGVRTTAEISGNRVDAIEHAGRTGSLCQFLSGNV